MGPKHYNIFYKYMYDRREEIVLFEAGILKLLIFEQTKYCPPLPEIRLKLNDWKKHRKLLGACACIL